MTETAAKSRGHYLVALAMASFTVALQLAWAYKDTSRPMNDDRALYHLSTCLAAPNLSIPKALIECSKGGTPYPPLGPLLAVAHYKLAGEVSVRLAIISQWPFYALLVLGLFYGVRREAGTLAGAAAAALGPLMLYETHMRGFFYTAIPLAALAVTSITCLRATEGFRRPLPSLGLGICLAAGLLTKWTFAFFLCPPMLLAVMLTLLRVGSRWWVGAVPAALFFGLTAATAGGLAGALPYGLVLGGISLALGFLYLALLWWRRPGLLAEGWRRPLVGIGLLFGSTAAVAGPWYLIMQETLQDFLGSNLSFQFDGDPMTVGTTWPYYLVVLYYRVPTPLLLLALAGVVRALLPGGSPLVRWSTMALVSGMIILTVMPYRTDRYLMPGIGLVVPSMVLAYSWSRRLKKGLCWALLGLGMLYQTGWLHPHMGLDFRRLPLSINSLGPPGIGGNDRAAIKQALKLMHPPTWHFNLFSLPPKTYAPPLAELAEMLQHQACKGCPIFVLLDHNQYFTIQDLEDEYLALAPNTRNRIRLTDLKQGKLQDWARELMPQWDQSLGWPQNFIIIQLIPRQNGPESAALTEKLSASGFKPFFFMKSRPGLDQDLQGWHPAEARASYRCGAASHENREDP